MKAERFSAPQYLALSFLAVIIVGSLLLSTPWATQHGSAPYIDALFTAASAVCVTGLVTVDTGTYWTTFGQVIIMLLIQVGGLGVMSFAAFFALLLGHKIQLRQRLLMQQAINVSAVGGIVKMVRYLLFFTFTIEAIGALILTIRWIPDFGIKKALWYGVFHSISAFNNAGFDLFGNFRSLTGYCSDITINLVISSLIIIGGLGFFVIFEISQYRQTHCLSLHSQVVLLTTGLLLVIGTLFIFCGEYNHSLKEFTLGTKFLASYFQSVSPRTAGFNTIDLTTLQLSTQLIFILLMFIGASPGSTGGGIKTSTFTILCLAIYSQLRGKKDAEIFQRRLDNTDVMQALTLILLALSALILGTFLLSLTHPGDLNMIIFEVASALGTVGLTLGLTTQLTAAGKLIIIITMFLGRVGPLTLGFALAYREKQPDIRYPKGKIMIG